MKWTELKLIHQFYTTVHARLKHGNVRVEDNFNGEAQRIRSRMDWILRPKQSEGACGFTLKFQNGHGAENTNVAPAAV